jgi:hypothetical protein
MAWAWRSRTTMAVAIGVPFSVWWIMSARLADTWRAGGLWSAPVAAAVFGVWTARLQWRRWVRAGELSPGDRVAVARAVHRGEAVGDPRLARAVIDYARVVGEEARSPGWVVLALGAGAVVLAVIADSGGEAVFFALCAGCLLSTLVLGPRLAARYIANARDAAAAATALLAAAD